MELCRQEVLGLLRDMGGKQNGRVLGSQNERERMALFVPSAWMLSLIKLKANLQDHTACAYGLPNRITNSIPS